GRLSDTYPRLHQSSSVLISIFLETGKCLAAEETVAVVLAAAAAAAVEDARCTLTWATQRQQPLRLLSLVLLPRRHTLRDLRWPLELRMAASADPTAPVILAIVNDRDLSL
ncbi:hypothetical protein P5F54_15160, partial [Clostridium perfringens]|nr:hypothetical protein [Clostridium perfringens]